jgi:predicted nuclease with TOPRIM domain
LKRRKHSLQVLEADATSEECEVALARDLDGARAEIARLERRLSVETIAARALRERVQTSAAAAEAAEKRAAGLETEFGAVRQQLQEKLDFIAAENSLLSRSFAERGIALDDAQARIKFLETALSAAEAEAAGERAEGLENGFRAASGQLAGKLDLVTAENARLTQSAIAKDAALGDARARIEFLEMALSAAEAECARLTAELGGAREKRQSETQNLNRRLAAMSSRAVTAEALLAEARERSLARIVEIDAFRQRTADAKAAGSEAYAKNRQLEDALCLQQCQVEDLERAHATLIEATKSLLETFQDRDHALTRAEEKIYLAARNAQLEAGAIGANGQGASDGLDIPRLSTDDADETKRKDLAELARLLSDFMQRKRRSSGQGEVRSMTILAGTMTF